MFTADLFFLINRQMQLNVTYNLTWGASEWVGHIVVIGYYNIYVSMINKFEFLSLEF